jgi:hypothetical protein
MSHITNRTLTSHVDIHYAVRFKALEGEIVLISMKIIHRNYNYSTSNALAVFKGVLPNKI